MSSVTLEMYTGAQPGLTMSIKHRRVVVGQGDDDVVGRVGAVPGKVDPLAADLERAAVLAGLLVRQPGRIVVAEQDPPRLLVPDAGDVLVEEERRPCMVGVVVRGDQEVE